MKKAFTFIILAAVLLATGSACGRNDDYAEFDNGALFDYVQFTPDDKIVKGKETALNTIKEQFDKDDVNVMLDYDLEFDWNSNPVYGSNESDEDYYLWYKVEKYPKEFNILFLFKDDTEILMGQNSKNPIYSVDVDEKRVDKNFAIETVNYEDGAFAWNDSESTNAVLGKDAGYRCTSIWGYNEQENKVVLIWNNTDCPIWQNYS